MEEIDQIKKALRKELAAKRDSITEAVRADADRCLCENVTALDALRQAETVLVYIPTGSEVSVWGIIRTAMEQGKTVAAPVCGKDHTMGFYAFTDDTQLIPGKYGIMAPDTLICPKVTDFSRAVCIVPGLAFDRAHYRIGYGGGYYDRFLAAHPGIYTVGVCRSAFIADTLPRDRYDMAVDTVATEKGCL